MRKDSCREHCDALAVDFCREHLAQQVGSRRALVQILEAFGAVAAFVVGWPPLHFAGGVPAETSLKEG